MASSIISSQMSHVIFPLIALFVTSCSFKATILRPEMRSASTPPKPGRPCPWRQTWLWQLGIWYIVFWVSSHAACFFTISPSLSSCLITISVLLSGAISRKLAAQRLPMDVVGRGPGLPQTSNRWDHLSHLIRWELFFLNCKINKGPPGAQTGDP